MKHTLIDSPDQQVGPLGQALRHTPVKTLLSIRACE